MSSHEEPGEPGADESPDDARSSGPEEHAAPSPAPPDATGFGDLDSIAPLGGLSGLFGQARDQLEEAEQEAGRQVVTGRAGGGSVEIQLTGNLEALSVKISPDVVDREDVGMLEDLVLAALRHALADAVEVREQAASSLFPSGLDLGAMMQGLFGGGGGAADFGAGAGAEDENGQPGVGGLDIFGSLGASLPAGMPAGLTDFMNELFGADGPIIEFDMEAETEADDGATGPDDGGEPGPDDDSEA